MKKLTLFTLLFAVTLMTGCDSFVGESESPVDSTTDESLNSPVQIPFLVQGIQADFSQSIKRANLLTDLLSDSHVFGSNADATFPTYREIDSGEIPRDNNSADNWATYQGEYLFLADDLQRRIEEDMEFDESQEDLRQRGLYIANFHGGIARYIIAAFQGIDVTEGGGVVEPRGEFQPSSELYSAAITKLDAAAGFVSNSYQTRLINSWKARIYIHQNQFTAAAEAAADGLVAGDAPFTALHSSSETNRFYAQSGVGRQQVVVAPRFVQAVSDTPAEANRIVLRQVDDGSAEFTQGFYLNPDDPTVILGWEEMNLIRAEAALQGEGLAGDDALTLVNEVRESFDLDPLASIDLETLLVERDRTLFTQGQRLVDQRRYDGAAPASVEFHLSDDVWRYLPVTQQECNDNPNISCRQLSF